MTTMRILIILAGRVLALSSVVCVPKQAALISVALTWWRGVWPLWRRRVVVHRRVPLGLSSGLVDVEPALRGLVELGGPPWWHWRRCTVGCWGALRRGLAILLLTIRLLGLAVLLLLRGAVGLLAVRLLGLAIAGWLLVFLWIGIC